MKHWVFDLDGTLVDSFERYFGALDGIFREHGAEFLPEHRRPALTEPLVDFFARHLGPARVERAFERLHRVSNEDARHIRAFDGIEPILRGLLDQGARVAVWTNRDLDSASRILEHSGLGRLTEACISGTCVIERKPRPEGLWRLIRSFDCKPAEVTMVGDHEHDVAAAREVGARSVRASWHAYWPEPVCSIADHQFGSVAEFDRWIRNS